MAHIHATGLLPFEYSDTLLLPRTDFIVVKETFVTKVGVLDVLSSLHLEFDLSCSLLFEYLIISYFISNSFELELDIVVDIFLQLQLRERVESGHLRCLVLVDLFQSLKEDVRLA